MNTAAPDYSHLKEVEFHPEMLHPLLRIIARTYGGELRWQHIGGKEDGATLFVSPVFPVPVTVQWTGMEYAPVRRPDMQMKQENPATYRVFLDAIRRRFQRPRE